MSCVLCPVSGVLYPVSGVFVSCLLHRPLLVAASRPPGRVPCVSLAHWQGSAAHRSAPRRIRIQALGVTIDHPRSNCFGSRSIQQGLCNPQRDQTSRWVNFRSCDRLGGSPGLTIGWPDVRWLRNAQLAAHLFPTRRRNNPSSALLLHRHCNLFHLSMPQMLPSCRGRSCAGSMSSDSPTSSSSTDSGRLAPVPLRSLAQSLQDLDYPPLSSS